MSEKILSMEKARALKALGLAHPEVADLLCTLEKDLIQGILLREQNATLRAKLEALRKVLGDVAGSFEAAMRQANRDGAEWNVDEELAELRAALKES